MNPQTTIAARAEEARPRFDVAAFLTAFFGDVNIISWPARDRDETSLRIATWVADLSRSATNRGPSTPVVLPRQYADGRFRWYALAFSASQFRALREDLMAFVGPTYTSFNGMPAELDPGDSVDAAVQALVGPYAYMFDLLDSRRRPEVWRAIETMRSLWRQRPTRSSSVPKPTGRILRDFEMALNAEDWESAGQAIEQLRSGGRLDPANLAYLKVRRLAAIGDWEALLALPDWAGLVVARRPAAVTEAMLRAVYHTQFDIFQRAGDAAAMLARFRATDPVLFAPLLRTCAMRRSPEVLKVLLLGHVAAGERHECDTLLQLARTAGVLDPFMQQLAALAVQLPAPLDARPAIAPEAVVVSPVDQGNRAFESGDFNAAFALLRNGPHTPAGAQKLLLCAVELGSLQTARVAADVINALPESQRREVLAPRFCRQAWEELLRWAARGIPADGTESQAEVPSVAATTVLGRADMATAKVKIDAAAAPPADWAQWIEQVNRDPQWPAAIETLRQGIVEWDPTPLRESSLMANRVADSLQARTAASTVVLRNALPHLLTSLVRSPGPAIPAMKPVYWQLLELLAYDDQLGANDLAAISELLGALLEIGLRRSAGVNELSDLVDLLDLAWAQVQSPRHLDWAIETIDQLVQHASDGPDGPRRLLQACLVACSQWQRRVRTEQWDVLELLCGDLKAADLYTAYGPVARHEAGSPAEAAAHDLSAALDGKTLTLYSLAQRTTARVEQVLSRRFPGARIRVSNDPDGSQRLKQLARESDYFIVNTYDALHAATDAIKQNRPNELITLFPRSKAWTAMVRALYEHLESVEQPA